MRKIIRLTESDLHNIIKESVKSILSEAGHRISASDTETGTLTTTRPKPKPKRRTRTPGTKITKWDEHTLDGIDSLQPNSIRYIISGLVGTIRTNTPFKPIHQLVKFFDKKRNNVGGKGMVYGILRSKMPNFEKRVRELNSIYAKIIALSQTKYGDFNKLNDFNLLLNELFVVVKDFTDHVVEAGATDYGSTITAIEGRDNGKDVGIRKIVMNAQKSLVKLSNITAKIEELVKKGKDPFSYNG